MLAAQSLSRRLTKSRLKVSLKEASLSGILSALPPEGPCMLGRDPRAEGALHLLKEPKLPFISPMLSSIHLSLAYLVPEALGLLFLGALSSGKIL